MKVEISKKTVVIMVIILIILVIVNIALIGILTTKPNVQPVSDKNSVVDKDTTYEIVYEQFVDNNNELVQQRVLYHKKSKVTYVYNYYYRPHEKISGTLLLENVEICVYSEAGDLLK